LRATSVTHYTALLDAVRRRKSELNLSFEMLDALSGVQSGYSAKLLGPTPSKRFGEVSLGAILGALAIKIVVTVDREQEARMVNRWQPRAVTVIDRLRTMPISAPQEAAGALNAAGGNMPS
jgi:hypothetical protein